MRLIDAEELGFRILEETSDTDETANKIYGFVINAPTIEAEPIRRGRNIYQQVKGHCEFKCSLCGVELGEVRGGKHDYGLDGGYFKYCPYCGAGMESEWIFTFGSGQPLAGYYVRFIGSYEEARKKMFEKFGNKWAFQYSAEEWAEYEKDPELAQFLEKELKLKD